MTDVRKLPDDELGKTNYDDMFKRTVGIEQVCGFQKEDGYVYKAVITNYPWASGVELVQNYEKHRKMGFEVVVTASTIKDDRVFSPNSNQRENTVPAPLIGKTSDGYDYVVMKIKQEVFDKYMKDKDERDDNERLKAIKGKVVQKGDTTYIKDDPEFLSPNQQKFN